MKFYNTLTKRIDEFVPNTPGKVALYTCGPTVYHFAHIGNLRSYIMEDILDRTLRYVGYDVKRVMNITDVGHLTSDADSGNDKMVEGAKREHIFDQKLLVVAVQFDENVRRRFLGKKAEQDRNGVLRKIVKQDGDIVGVKLQKRFPDIVIPSFSIKILDILQNFIVSLIKIRHGSRPPFFPKSTFL